MKNLSKLQAFALRMLAGRLSGHGIDFGHEELMSQIVPYTYNGPLQFKKGLEMALLQNDRNAIDESDGYTNVTVKFNAFDFELRFNAVGQLNINCIEKSPEVLTIKRELLNLVEAWQREASACGMRSAESDMATISEQTFNTCASQLLEILEKHNA